MGPEDSLARRSYGTPLALGIVLLVLVVALAVGWQFLVLDRGLEDFDWVFLVLGAVFFLLVIAGLVWLSWWLVLEIRLNQRQRAFLDAVTHEMKTPLASLRLYLDTLDKRDPDRERRQEFLGRMRDDVARLDQTVEQVLAAARAEDTGSRAQLETVALSELLRQCIRDVAAHHHFPEDTVRLELGAGDRVRGDPSELQLIFRNLIENAVKYSDAPAEVRVRIGTTEDGRVEVEIADQGIGIPSGELRKIFQRFYRVGRDVQRTAAGLGLGLYIVRNLVRRQGGRVVARSDGRGHGSRFVVTLRGAA
jgi:signal transduction histidine kinase